MRALPALALGLAAGCGPEVPDETILYRFQNLRCVDTDEGVISPKVQQPAALFGVGSEVLVAVQITFCSTLPFFGGCSTAKQVHIESTDPAVWTVVEQRTNGALPQVLLRAVGPGTGGISVTVDGRLFKGLVLRAEPVSQLELVRFTGEPDILNEPADRDGVSVVKARVWALSAMPLLAETRVVANGELQVFVRARDAQGTDLCGNMPLTTSATGASWQPLARPFRLDEQLTLKIDEHTQSASVGVSVGAASEDLVLGVVEVAAIDAISVEIDGRFQTPATYVHLRLRTFAGDAQVAGATVRVETLTPSIGLLADPLDSSQESVKVVRLGAPAEHARVRASVAGSAAAPVEYEFVL